MGSSKIRRKDKWTITLVECQNLISRTIICKSKQNWSCFKISQIQDTVKGHTYIFYGVIRDGSLKIVVKTFKTKMFNRRSIGRTFFKDYRVAKLPKAYIFVIGIIMQSSKSIGQF